MPGKKLTLLLCVAVLALNASPPQESKKEGPKQLARRIGFYQWAGEAERSPEEDLLTAARRAAAETGSRVFRFYVGSRFDYVHPLDSPQAFREDGVEGALTPARIVQIPRYDAAIADPSFETVMLTVYTVANYGAGPAELSLTRHWTPADEDRVRNQISELCNRLYERFGAVEKTVILANSEVDEKLLEILNYTGSPELALENLYQWNQARFEAVAAARARRPRAKLKIFHAFEISLVNLRIARRGPVYRKSRAAAVRDLRPSWNALEDLVPRISFDLLSYSAYETINAPWRTGDLHAAPAGIEQRLVRDLEKIRETAQDSVSAAGRRSFGENWIFVGEAGFAREAFEELPEGGVLPRLHHTLRAAVEWGCPYIVLWQVFDSPRSGRTPSGYGMIGRHGRRPRLRHPPGGCASIESCLQLLFEQGFEAWEGAGPPVRSQR